MSPYLSWFDDYIKLIEFDLIHGSKTYSKAIKGFLTKVDINGATTVRMFIRESVIENIPVFGNRFKTTAALPSGYYKADVITNKITFYFVPFLGTIINSYCQIVGENVIKGRIEFFASTTYADFVGGAITIPRQMIYWTL